MRQTLRPDQVKVIADVKSAARAKARAILVHMPTGGGKTTVAAALVESAQEKRNPCWVTGHREELAEQAAQRLRGQGVRVGVWMGTKESTDPSAGGRVF